MDQTTASEINNAYRNRVTVGIYYAMTGLILIAFGLFVLRGNWDSALSTAFIFLLMFVPSIVKERYRLYLPFAVEFAITVFIFLTLFLGEVGRFYERIPLWDKFLHFQSGLLLGVTGFLLIYILNEHKKFKLGLSPGFVAIFAVTFSLSIGVLWEVVEFAGDAYFSTHAEHYHLWQASNADTMWDLIADGSGALLVSIGGYFWMYRNKRLPFTPWLFRMKERLKKPINPTKAPIEPVNE